MRAPITLKGAQRLREELDHLKTVKRPKVIAAIAEAREHGDLKENAEYHAAREEQGFIEGRIKQLEGELSHAEIIDITKLNAGSKVVFGATVELADVESEEEKRYQIVGDLEADIKLGLIAISSPVARALIGKNEGDSIVIDAPAADRNDMAIILAPFVDMTVLVIAAESTAAHAPVILRDEIEAVGGKIAGVVMNRSTYKAPGFLRRLMG